MPSMSPLNRLFHHISLNADRLNDGQIVEAYTPLGAIEGVLESPQTQILYGRRGTGKTHTLRTLAQRVDPAEELSIYVDLRLIGSSGALYSDTQRSLGERATYVLTDVVKMIHGALLDLCRSDSTAEPMFDSLELLLDACGELRVEGPLTVTKGDQTSIIDGTETTAGLSATAALAPRISGKRANTRRTGKASTANHELAVSGVPTLHVDVGEIHWALKEALTTVAPRRMLIIIDEWSACPIDIQPYLADLLRRCIMPLPNVRVKIGAIEGRSRFFLGSGETRGQVGIQVGSDTAASVVLDQHLSVKDESVQTLRWFFAQLVLRHMANLRMSARDLLIPDGATALISAAFQAAAFEELVVASEGNPRDFLNILARAASLAQAERISVGHVQKAALQYLILDKQHSLHGNPSAQQRWKAVRRLVRGSKSRVFLVPTEGSNELRADVGHLYDMRLIHRLAQGVITRTRPHNEFDAYAIDYGHFVQELAYSELSERWTDPSEGAWATLQEVDRHVGRSTPILK